MSRGRLARGLLLSVLLPVPAQAQLSELRFGAIGSFVAADAYRWGAGLTVGYAPGRLASVGLRWIYYFGSTEQQADASGSYDVTNRAQLFGADLALEFPLGAAEIVAGGTLGAVRFWQRTAPVGNSATEAVATEFVVAPMVMLLLRTGRVMLVPQIAYYFAGSPDLRWPVDHAGLALSLSVVFPIETDRIRY